MKTLSKLPILVMVSLIILVLIPVALVNCKADKYGVSLINRLRSYLRK